jgi:hypothetical protein
MFRLSAKRVVTRHEEMKGRINGGDRCPPQLPSIPSLSLYALELLSLPGQPAN